MGMSEKSQKGIEGLLQRLKEKETEAKVRSEAEQLRRKSKLLHSGAFGGRLKSENSLFILQRLFSLPFLMTDENEEERIECLI